MNTATRAVNERIDLKKPAETADEATEILPLDARVQSDPYASESTHIGEYEIDSVLGEGGGGKVYAARRHGRGERVAIKVLRPEMVPMPHLVVRFNREIEAIDKIRHPNIVRIIECGETERGQPYYVMELLEGMTLRRLLQLHGRFSARETLDLIDPVCKAVQAVHDAGFVHRDIKASNVLVVESDGERRVKLLDFGIAKTVHGEAGPGLTEPGVKLGSVHNMAPEQVRCEKIDARADVYSLGVVMFQLLTGEYPFQAEDPRQIALMHLQAPAPRPSSLVASVSPAIDAVVLRCLEKQAQTRFASADELLATLRIAVGEPPSAADERELPALGIYIELTTPPDVELDDAMIEDMSNVLDRFEHVLSTRQFEFPLRTSNALLAVHVTPANDNASRDAGELTSVVAELRAALGTRESPHPDVTVSLSARIDAVRCRPSERRHEVVGGTLLDMNTWTADHHVRD